jgi:hypothetical protein
VSGSSFVSSKKGRWQMTSDQSSLDWEVGVMRTWAMLLRNIGRAVKLERRSESHYSGQAVAVVTARPNLADRRRRRLLKVVDVQQLNNLHSFDDNACLASAKSTG